MASLTQRLDRNLGLATFVPSALLEALGNLGDFVGGIAVILTLVYLAVQVGQNTKQIAQNSKIVAASAYQDLTELIHESNARIATNREFAELRLRGRDGIGQLDEVDRFRLMASISSLFRMFENMHQQFEAGLISSNQYAGWKRLMKFHLSHAGTREVWQLVSMMFSDEFQSRVEAILQKQERDESGS